MTGYVYNEETSKCLVKLKGTREAVESLAGSYLEQHGYPMTWSANDLNDVETAEEIFA